MITAYWFFGDTLRDGSPIPADGEWLEHDGPLELCQSGLHASEHPRDALWYAPGVNLALVELDGEMVRGDDKLCARRRRIVKRINATEMLLSFAREAALSVIHLWEAPPSVCEYLKTGNEALRKEAYGAAYAAAADAATADAVYAAYAATAAAADAVYAAATTAATTAAADAYAAADAAADAADAAADAAAYYADAVSAAAAADAADIRQCLRERFAELVSAAFAPHEG